MTMDPHHLPAPMPKAPHYVPPERDPIDPAPTLSQRLCRLRASSKRDTFRASP